MSRTRQSARKPERRVQELWRLKTLELPPRHEIALGDIHPERLSQIFLQTYERQPSGFESLLGLEGVGPKTLRALSLLSELVYGVAPSYRDPARYSFAHGGKDGIPYPVNQQTYDKSLAVLRRAIHQAKLGQRASLEAFRRLSQVERGMTSATPDSGIGHFAPTG